ncbi:MAG: hypothetical protein ACYSX0_13005 [Planctomycetota bacterium]|jgi:hypothetical protein
MKLRLIHRLRSRLRAPRWLEELDAEQRRTLIRNLRGLVESKRTLERQITETAPRR